MKNVLLTGFIITILSGCAASHTEQLSAARGFVEQPMIINVPEKQANFQLLYGNDPALEKAFKHYVSSGKAPNIITDGFVKFAYNKDQQPLVHASPFQETVISLEPGEKFTNVSSGDPSRWSYAAAISGTGSVQQQNILVKPSLPNISTNMVITTDRRIYNLKLVSTMDADLTRSVSFWYPEEMVQSLNAETVKTANEAAINTMPDVNLNHLNFNYKITGGSLFGSLPSWKPIRVFDDGTHTYIQFPSSMANKDMPVLFIKSGYDQALVNYRAKPPYFVVDKLFKQAVLVMGAGQSQSKVIITNQCYS